MADYELDARFLLCPLPVLKAQKKLRHLKAGDTLEITGTSEGGIKEFEIFCGENDCKIIESEQQAKAWSVRLFVL